MRRSPLRLGLLAALVWALSPVGGAEAAKTHTEPALRIVEVEVPGSKDWRISIGTVVDPRFPKPTVSVGEQRTDGVSVDFGAQGRVDPDGGIRAKLHGVGRIALRFEATKTEKIDFSPQAGCTAEGPSLRHEGYFRGRIGLGGGAGLPSIERTAAPGTITDLPTETCSATKPWVGTGSDEEGFLTETQAAGPIDSLFAGTRLRGGSLNFSAALGLESYFGEAHGAVFDVGWIRRAHGVTTSVSDTMLAPSRHLVFSPPTGTPTEATVDPPRPFQGSAAFKLESPSVASWTGDLRIDLPILGEVSLTAPGTYSAVCQNLECSDTLPPGVGVTVTAVG